MVIVLPFLQGHVGKGKHMLLVVKKLTNQYQTPQKRSTKKETGLVMFCCPVESFASCSSKHGESIDISLRVLGRAAFGELSAVVHIFLDKKSMVMNNQNKFKWWEISPARPGLGWGGFSRVAFSCLSPETIFKQLQVSYSRLKMERLKTANKGFSQNIDQTSQRGKMS